MILNHFDQAFDLINHAKLAKKLLDTNLALHLVRWMAAFLLQSEQS